jgi:eukaryotic-like serine/threonine-protein kinase
MTAEFSQGQHIGDYEVLSILGVGGMGKVYKVRNVISDRIEAMKILLPDLRSNQSLADRFLREIRLLATLNHPNIAALRTALTYENQLVMILEFVEGETLANRLARAPLSTAETINYADQVLSALSYAHKQNIIHRDIKPANMMLTPQSVVKLMDFGIARAGSDNSITSTGTTLGSVNYMPPEQVRGEPADARSDIYSFGVSLYEMLTGKLPFHGDSQYLLMSAHLNQTPPAPITLRSDLPPGLNEIIMTAMAKDPASRFQSADAFRAALNAVPLNAAAATAASQPKATPPTGGTTLMDPPSPSRVPTTAPRSQQVAPSAASSPAPTMPMAAAATSANAAAPPPPIAQRSGSRTVWLAIGAVLGVGVVITAAMYVPRHFGTHADPSKSAFATKSPAQQDAEPPASQDKPKSDASASTPSSDSSSNAATPETPAAPATPATPTNADKKDRASAKPSPSKAQSSAAQETNAEPAPPPGPSPEEIAKAEDEADKLNIRAAAATHSVDTLRQQQTNAGYNLRGDIAASYDRLQNYLNKGNAALAARDLKSAQKYFDLADAELTKLEKFLGH